MSQPDPRPARAPQMTADQALQVTSWLEILRRAAFFGSIQPELGS